MRITLALWWTITSALLLAQSFSAWSSSLSTAELPNQTSAALGVTMALGAALCIVGLAPNRLASRSWRLQRAGAIIAGAAWLGNGAAAAILHPWAIYHPLSSLVMGALAFAWLRRLGAEEQHVRSRLGG